MPKAVEHVNALLGSLLGRGGVHFEPSGGPARDGDRKPKRLPRSLD